MPVGFIDPLRTLPSSIAMTISPHEVVTGIYDFGRIDISIAVWHNRYRTHPRGVGLAIKGDHREN